MIRLDKREYKKTGIKTQVRVVEGYFTADKKVKQRTIKNFGYLENQSDPEAFMKEVQEFNEEFFINKKKMKALKAQQKNNDNRR